MNTVYELSLPKEDSHAGMCWPIAPTRTPKLECAACGCTIESGLWLASVSAKVDEKLSPVAPPLIGESVASMHAYGEILSALANTFQLSGRTVAPGTWLSAQTVTLGEVTGRGALNADKLRNRIDVIAAARTWLFSRRLVVALEAGGIQATFGQVKFACENETFDGYFTEEFEPKLVLTQAEQDKYQAATCSQCRTVYRKTSFGTFRKKLFLRELFEGAPKIVRGAEFPGLYLNRSAHDLLSKLEPSGCSFTVAGSW